MNAALCLRTILALALGCALPACGQVQTIKSGTRLVVLDVTVLDHDGRTVNKGLTRQSFHIAEDKRAQTVLSFESPQEHLSAAHKDKLPLSIFVLDEESFPFRGNSSDQQAFSEMYQLRAGLADFLKRQQPRMPQETEILASTRNGLQVVAPFSADRDGLLDALRRHDPPLPNTLQEAIDGRTYGTSVAALRVLALQNRSVAGRKNVIWLGRGANAKVTDFRYYQAQHAIDDARQVNNLLVEARMCLNVVGPGIGASEPLSSQDALAAIQENLSYGYETDLGFSGFIRATGGEFHNRNDFDDEMQQAVNYGSQYYTLSYRPDNSQANGKFRRIQVTVDGTKLQALTKAGYYATDFGGQKDEAHEAALELSSVAFAPLAFTGISLSVETVARHPGTDRVEFTLRLGGGQVQWEPDETAGQSTAQISLAASSFGAKGQLLTSQLKSLELKQQHTDPALTAAAQSSIAISLVVPKKAATVRFALRDQATGRLGSVDLPRVLVDAAPELPLAQVGLKTRH